MHFSFGPGFQRAVLRLMMIDDEFASRALQWVDASMFTAPSFGWMYTLFSQHWDTWNQRCSDLVLYDALRRLPDDKRGRYSAEVDAVVLLGDVPEAEWIKAQLAEFVKQAIFARAHHETIAPFNAGDHAGAYRVMMEAMERIQLVDFRPSNRAWLFDELADRQRQRVRAAMDPLANRFSTGIVELDKLTDGGVHRGELWAVFAYAKRCKTTWLINQGFHATRVHRRPTLHLLLEGRLDAVTARYDACFSQELYEKVKRGEIQSGLYYQLQQEYAVLRKLMVIRRLEGWDNTILDIRAELSYLRAQGFRPEMLITDYMDLGRKRDPGRNESETSHQIAFSRDLKRLHENENLAGWSAWQAQRPAKDAHTKEHVLMSGSVADAYAKVRIVTAYGSLNATDAEMDEGEMRYYQEGHRDAAVNRTWLITNDLSRMRMITSVVPTTAKAEGAA